MRSGAFPFSAHSARPDPAQSALQPIGAETSLADRALQPTTPSSTPTDQPHPPVVAPLPTAENRRNRHESHFLTLSLDDLARASKEQGAKIFTFREALRGKVWENFRSGRSTVLYNADPILADFGYHPRKSEHFACTYFNAIRGFLY